MELGYRSDIDGLRAIAVLPVVLYHAGAGLDGGFVGVDVFFVISGYLIVGLIHREMAEGRFSFLEFYARRIRRLYPALFVVLIATTIWAVARMLWLDLINYAESLASAIVYLSNQYFFAQTGYFTEEATIKPLLHTWSLAVEEQFYLLAPVMLLVLVRRCGRQAMLAIVAVLVGLSFAAGYVATGYDRSMAFYLAPFRFWEIGLGALLALVGSGGLRGRPLLADGLGVAGLAAIIYAVFAFDRAIAFPGWHAAVPSLGAVAVISAGSAGASVVPRLLSLPSLVLIGKISYPLYLWHWPVIVAFVYGPLNPLTPGHSVAVIGISFILAYLTWRYIEDPIRYGSLFANRRRVFSAATAASMVALSVAATLFLGEGWPGRHDPELVRMVSERGLLDKNRWLHADRKCHVLKSANFREGLVCLRGAEVASPSFAFVGDSHADAASPAIFAAAEHLGLSGYQLTMPGFIPLPGRGVKGEASTSLTADFFAFFQDRPEIETIIITGWWHRARTGESYRDYPMVHVDEYDDGRNPAVSNPATFDRALDRLSAAFSGRRVILLDDVPGGRALDIKAYVRTYAVTGKAPPPGLARQEADRQRALYEPALSAAAARHSNIEYVKVFDGLCGTEICPIFASDGTLIFRDGDHLSNTGALALQDRMAGMFRRSIAASPTVGLPNRSVGNQTVPLR